MARCKLNKLQTRILKRMTKGERIRGATGFRFTIGKTKIRPKTIYDLQLLKATSRGRREAARVFSYGISRRGRTLLKACMA